MEEAASDYDNKIEKEAIAFVKYNGKFIQKLFANLTYFPPNESPVSFFMAGSPGAGKTEFSKEFIKNAQKPFVRIDADEIRNILPMYNKNASMMQKAAALGVEKVYDFALHHHQDLILDGTLIDFNKAVSNIQRSLKHNRKVEIFYIYQDPKLAWEFTKKRESIEHRSIPKSFFIQSFFQSKSNADRLKSEFGDRITLNLIVKNFENDLDTYIPNIETIDSHLKIGYTVNTLEDILR